MFRRINSARLRAIARWLKSHPVVAILGVIATVFGVIKGAPAAWSVTMHAVGLPDCITYSKTYRHAGGYFALENGEWIEYPSFRGKEHFKFREVRRDPEYVYLLNLTPRAGRASTMLLRFPVCGGTAQWTYQNPQQWTDLYTVWR
jgi:hypothetical protein